MEDTPDTRAEIARLLKHTEHADRIGIGRFRRHTLGSRIGNTVDKIVDEFTGPEDDEGTAGRNAPRGVRIWVHREGAPVHEWEVHPVRDDFEKPLLALVVTTARRLRSALEIYVDDEAVFHLDKTWWSSPHGYREAPINSQLPALPSEQYTWTDDGLSFVHRWSPTLWAMPLVALLAVGCLPIVALLMLIRDTRVALLGLAKSIFLGGKVSWKWARRGTWNFELSEEGSAAVSVQPQEVLLFLPMPHRWSKPAGDCQTLWAVKELDAVSVPLATSMDARWVAGVLAHYARRSS